ncbi:MAG: hypothetical protein LAO05_01615 [Acidobacteriia bacterium]|nr:hypothetical protein [Terriglobia bacterium]
MKVGSPRDLFVHPSESTGSRFAMWLLLSGVATAFVTQIFGTGGLAFWAGMIVLSIATSVVTPRKESDKALVLGAAGVAVAFFIIFAVVGLILTFESRLGFLEPSTDSRVKAGVMPTWYRGIMWCTWLVFAGYEVHRFYAKRRRHAA